MVSMASCTNPLHAFVIGTHPSGKDKYKICNHRVQHLELRGSQWIPCYNDIVDIQHCSKWITSYIEVPCRKCINCRLNYAKQWSQRCMLEAQYYSDNYFLTLTYDNDYLPLEDLVNQDGEIIEKVPTLRKRDLQLFMKRLRKHFEGTKVRFFGVGEYGGQTMRPHYHLILFNLPLNDLEYLKCNARGDKFYISETISKLWPFGFHMISDVNQETANYTARYCLKKATSDFVLTDVLHIEKEFTLMSRRPGIARQYYEDHKDTIFDYTNIAVIPTRDGLEQIKSVKYYNNLYDVDFPDKSARLKEQRKISAIQSVMKERKQTTYCNNSDLYIHKHELVKRKFKRSENLSRKEL